MSEVSDNADFAVVSASMKYDGMYADARLVYDIVKGLGHRVNFYQCIDVHQKDEFSDFGQMLPGKSIKHTLLETAFNRFFTFPSAIGKLREDIVIVNEQTLLNSVGQRKGIVVRILDTLRLGGLQKDVPSTLSALFATLIWHRTLARKLTNAEKLLVPSEFVRREVIKLGASPASVYVVYSALSKNRSARFSSKPKELSSDGIIRCLYVAADRPHKNIGFFIDMADVVEKSYPGRFEFHLLSNLSHKSRYLLSSKAHKNLVIHSNVPDTSSLYENADILLFPSRYEGFGRPVIEAMSYGIPVIANKVGPLAEIMGSAGRLCSTDNMQQWIESLVEMTNDSVYASESLSSRENSRRLSENAVATQLKAALRI